jgi:hypothetical protein
MRPSWKFRIELAQQVGPARMGALSNRRHGWSLWVIVFGVLCFLGAPGRSYADPDFSEFTKHKPFRLNTLDTTVVDGVPTPAWADILLKPENFLECKGAAIALCYYSGPGSSVTPCELVPGQEIANCTCYEIPHGPSYFVDINAILNLDVYLDTVSVCGDDGSNCLPRGQHHAPVCDAINGNKLIPGADLISTFSLFLEQEIPIDQTSCETAALYAGCMTAPCRRTGDIDPTTGLPLVQCACPTFNGPFQVGQNISQDQCVLGGNNVWSAAYAPNQGMIFPTPPTPPDCLPDSPGPSGFA